MQGWSTCQLSAVLTSRVRSPAFPWLVHPLQHCAKGGGSSIFAPSVLALPHLDHQKQLYCVALVRRRGLSPEHCSWCRAGTALPTLLNSEPALPPAKGGERQGRGHLSSAHASTWQLRGGTRSPTLSRSQPIHPHEGQYGQFHCVAQAWCRSRFPRC